jgi:hypothetical protein
MGHTMQRKDFTMTEKPGRDREISRRETEIMRAELISMEMASAVRLLGGNGSAKEQITKAARETRLPLTVIERLRWRKIKRIPADIADVIREAVNKSQEEGLRRAEHELFIAKHKEAALLARIDELTAGQYRHPLGEAGRQVSTLGGSPHQNVER